MSNIAAMLAPGGVFLHNEARPVDGRRDERARPAVRAIAPRGDRHRARRAGAALRQRVAASQGEGSRRHRDRLDTAEVAEHAEPMARRSRSELGVHRRCQAWCGHRGAIDVACNSSAGGAPMPHAKLASSSRSRSSSRRSAPDPRLGWLSGDEQPRTDSTGLVIRQDQRAGTLSVFRAGRRDPILTQNARPDARPYLHPIAAPDGKGVVTEFSPEHHKHQTGLYWGFTRVNGRDYFHNPQGDYWRRVSATVTAGERRRGPLADGLRPARRGEERRPDRNRALVDARRERPVRARPRVARRGQDRRHDRQVRLRRAVPAHAVARGHAGRGRQRRAAAQRARRRPARDVDRRRRCRSRAASDLGARRDLRSSRQRRLSAGLARRWPVRRRRRRDRAPPTGRSRRARPKSSAIGSSSTPARSTTSS